MSTPWAFGVLVRLAGACLMSDPARCAEPNNPHGTVAEHGSRIRWAAPRRIGWRTLASGRGHRQRCTSVVRGLGGDDNPVAAGGFCDQQRFVGDGDDSIESLGVGG